MERRERQNLNRTQPPRPERSVGESGNQRTNKLSSWVRIGLRANKEGETYNNLFSHINAENLRQAYQALDGSKAVGIDNISKDNYRRDLENNLQTLLKKLHSGTYRPRPKREVLIPKANGKTRPIAIACFEDKLVEWVLSKILETIYEPIFIKTSFGFRPKKSAHDAVESSYNTLKDNKRSYVVEIDLANFFNTVPHRKLIKLLQIRISDERLLGLIARLLKAEIMREVGPVMAETGTPQGSVVSPILANIYLHYVLDTWFLENYGSKEAVIVRYADDAVFMFSSEAKATEFMAELRARFDKFGLSINEDKTGIINFRKGQERVFHFLGFTFYWNHRKGWNKCKLVVKTQVDKLNKKIKEYEAWLKLNRARHTTKEIWKITAAKLRGHYNYYGYYCNRPKLSHFYDGIISAMYKWLNRRSQRKSFNWKKFKAKLKKDPLPLPPRTQLLRHLGWSPYVK